MLGEKNFKLIDESQLEMVRGGMFAAINGSSRKATHCPTQPGEPSALTAKSLTGAIARGAVEGGLAGRMAGGPAATTIGAGAGALIGGMGHIVETSIQDIHSSGAWIPSTRMQDYGNTSMIQEIHGFQVPDA